MTRTMRTTIGAVLVATMLGCGSGAAKPAAVVDVPAAGAAAAKADPGARVPSKALRDAFVPSASDLVAYVDVESLVHAPVAPELGAQLERVTRGALEPAVRACLATFVEAAKELAVTKDLLVARIDPASEEKVGGCVPRLVEGATKTTVAGLPRAWRAREVVGLGRGLVVVGAEPTVVKAFAGRAVTTSPLDDLRLGPDEHAAFRGTLDFRGLQGTMRGTLLANAARLRLGVSADLDEPTATQIAARLSPSTLAQGAAELVGDGDVEAARILKRVLAGLSVARRGGTLDVALDLEGKPAEQAEVIGGAVAVGVSGVRRYIASAKAAEARNVAWQIARDVATAWEREYEPGKDPFRAAKGKPRRLVSFPAVPKDVPRGTKYESTIADWKAYEPLRFVMTEPQYYQYEVVAAKDGKSAEIIARGDLNGDGKTSTFKRRVVVEGDRLVFDPNVDEIDALE